MIEKHKGEIIGAVFALAGLVGFFTAVFTGLVGETAMYISAGFAGLGFLGVTGLQLQRLRAAGMSVELDPEQVAEQAASKVGDVCPCRYSQQERQELAADVVAEIRNSDISSLVMHGSE